jgi:hypothetical protein
MILRLADSLNKKYSTIFFLKDEKLVFKVYKSYRHQDNAEYSAIMGEQDFNKWMYNIYHSELAACDIVCNSKYEKFFLKYIPNNSYSRITDNENNDISFQYLPDCFLAFNHIAGTPFDQHSPIVRTYCLSNDIELDKIFVDLRSMGIKHIKDINVVFTRHHVSKIVLFDYATCSPFDLRPVSIKEQGLKKIICC